VPLTLLPLGALLLTVTSLINRAVTRTLAIIALVGIVLGFVLQMALGESDLFLVASALTAGTLAALGLGLWQPPPTPQST